MHSRAKRCHSHSHPYLVAIDAFRVGVDDVENAVTQWVSNVLTGLWYKSPIYETVTLRFRTPG